MISPRLVRRLAPCGRWWRASWGSLSLRYTVAPIARARRCGRGGVRRAVHRLRWRGRTRVGRCMSPPRSQGSCRCRVAVRQLGACSLLRASRCPALGTSGLTSSTPRQRRGASRGIALTVLTLWSRPQSVGTLRRGTGGRIVVSPSVASRQRWSSCRTSCRPMRPCVLRR